MDLRRAALSAIAFLAFLASPVSTALADPPGAAAPAEAKQGSPATAVETPHRRWRPPVRQEQEEDPAARARVVAPRTARYFNKARELLLAEQYDEAREMLSRLHPRRLNPYERALLSRLQAYVAYGKGEHDTAATLLQAALAENSLSSTDVSDVLFQIAQIQGLQQKWPEALETLQAWFQTTPTPGSAAYFQLGLAYFQMQDLDAAVGPAQKAVELAQVPQQSWLQLLLAIQLTRQDYAAATPVLVELITLYPEVGASYWLQLSALYGVQKDVPRALAVLEIARRRGIVTEDRDLRRLAQLSQSEGMPLRAVRVLEEALAQEQVQPDAAVYELLGNSWILARDPQRAEEPLAKAAELSPEGDLYVRLAQVMLQNGQWEQAAGALHSAVVKGGLDDPSNAELLLGIAYYNADHLPEARTWFTRARQGHKTRASADAWLEHIDRELQTNRSTSLG
jgi:tetratricopeptide (TPR) repeat protein